MRGRRLKRRPLTTAYDHPTIVPNAIPPAPRLRFRDHRSVPSLGEILFLPLNDLRAIPLGYLNLICATMLPDTANLDIPACMRTLAEWTELVQRETEKQFYQFRRSPADFNNSEAYFRVLTMITVLQCDLHVTYDLECTRTSLFKSSREGFIHGLLTGDRKGTCANMPVLYAAIGRALGYPIYLVGARTFVLPLALGPYRRALQHRSERGWSQHAPGRFLLQLAAPNYGCGSIPRHFPAQLRSSRRTRMLHGDARTSLARPRAYAGRDRCVFARTPSLAV